MNRLGNHRIRPALSRATRSKPVLAELKAKISEARRRGDQPAVERLERLLSWETINSLTS